MVSICLTIFNFSSPLSNIFGDPFKCANSASITVAHKFHSFLSSLAKSKYFSLFSLALIFSVICRDGKVHYSGGSLFSFLIITRSGLLAGIRYLKIPRNFMRLILLNGFWFVQISFSCMIKFQFLAQFPVAHLSHPVVSSLLHPLIM